MKTRQSKEIIEISDSDNHELPLETPNKKQKKGKSTNNNKNISIASTSSLMVSDIEIKKDVRYQIMRFSRILEYMASINQIKLKITSIFP